MSYQTSRHSLRSMQGSISLTWAEDDEEEEEEKEEDEEAETKPVPQEHLNPPTMLMHSRPECERKQRGRDGQHGRRKPKGKGRRGKPRKWTRTAGFKRCNYFVVTYSSFPFIIRLRWTDRPTDRHSNVIFELSLTVSWCMSNFVVIGTSERTFFVVRK